MEHSLPENWTAAYPFGISLFVLMKDRLNRRRHKSSQPRPAGLLGRELIGIQRVRGRTKSTKSRPGNRYLKGALGIAALSAARTNNTHLSAIYKRITSRRGPSKALVAVEHSMLTAIWHVLTTGELYRDPGPDYFIRRTRANPSNKPEKRAHQPQPGASRLPWSPYFRISHGSMNAQKVNAEGMERVFTKNRSLARVGCRV